jgi:16S rRNA (guanine(527)-N(7))-methyltransferase RsmG
LPPVGRPERITVVVALAAARRKVRTAGKTLDSDAISLGLGSDVRAVAEHYGLGPSETGAVTIFVERLRSDASPALAEKWRTDALARVAQSLDALALEPVRRATEVADLGTGAGFPGLVLAAALPQARVTLVEKDGRRSRFLRDCVEAMSLSNVEVVECSVEDWTAGQQGRFDLVTSRGLWPPPVMVEVAAPLLKVGGSLVLWAPRAPTAKIEQETLAVRGDSLISTRVVGEGRLCLQAYTRADSPSDSATVASLPLLPSARLVPRREWKVALRLRVTESRLAEVSELIAQLEAHRSPASRKRLQPLYSRFERLKTLRTALAEQLANLRD